VRKPRRLSAEEMAPWVWELPRDAAGRALGLKGTAAALPNPPPAPARIDWAAL
jgi:tRNA (guanine-N7-)-methyltransferase